MTLISKTKSCSSIRWNLVLSFGQKNPLLKLNQYVSLPGSKVSPSGVQDVEKEEHGGHVNVGQGDAEGVRLSIAMGPLAKAASLIAEKLAE